MGLNKTPREELCGSDEKLAAALQNPEFKAIAPAIILVSLMTI